MATERNGGTMAEFFKLVKFGQKVIGRIDEYHEARNGNSAFVVISPVLIREEPKDAVMTRYHGVAIGLTTDLVRKVTDKDIGHFLSIEYVSSEPTNKGSPRKIFRVLELEKMEMLELAREAAAVDGVYKAPARTIAADGEQAADDDGDDLPF